MSLAPACYGLREGLSFAASALAREAKDVVQDGALATDPVRVSATGMRIKPAEAGDEGGRRDDSCECSAAPARRGGD